MGGWELDLHLYIIINIQLFSHLNIFIENVQDETQPRKLKTLEYTEEEKRAMAEAASRKAVRNLLHPLCECVSAQRTNHMRP